jgi:octaprenyl-diphosphate synthase
MNVAPKKLSFLNDLPFDVRSARFIEFFEAHLSDLLTELDSEVRGFALDVALSGGKRIRPLLTFHFAGHNIDSQDSLIKASAILELVHLATLIHDDILDDAEVRRNLPSLHKKIGSHAAVLLGDSLFGYALELAAQFPTTRICAIVAEATRKTCSGEIRQTFSRGRTDVSLDEYLSFVHGKTGELFKASCEIGAYLSGADEETIQVAGKFGLSLGINYQVFDDLIDSFESQSNIDKSIGSDLDTGKMTLPLILLRDIATVDELSRFDDLFSSPRESINLHTKRAFVHSLLDKYDILNVCVKYFHSHLEETYALIEQLPSDALKSDLFLFLQSFSAKFKKLNNLKTCNFLAV